MGSKPDYGYLVPSPEGTTLCNKGERECNILGRKSACSVWDQDRVVVMLVARREGFVRRRVIADTPDDFWNLAHKSWELIALG